jgi:hypothetical protein
MQAATIEIHYGGTPMEVYQQPRGGGLRLNTAPPRDRLGVVQETWKRGALGKTFLVRPIAGQILGEEVVDSAGRVIAVFGLAITNAFLPDPRPQREYREKLQTLLNQL